ncbi:hypothetical protein EZS27_015687 [termite gut metagenome]|uniref:DUF4959 domain-containing protein n=1 Tax=termite gut metagenome TaxID=433724 RepID=A0A5J4RRM1_9ZZZZ
MKKIISIMLLIATFFVWYGCEEGRLNYIDNLAPAPAPVTLDAVTSKPGGAVIKYKIPNDRNLLGVKAVYIRNGELCETKASLYVDSLIVEGFGDTQPKEVKLYSVGKNGKLSEPLSVQVMPLTPSVFSAQIDMESGFGGVIVALSANLSKANLALVLMIDTLKTGDWIPLQTFYTQSTSMKFSRRGLKPEEQQFALYIRDRWNNKSDTLFKDLIPIAEEKIPKDKFKNAKLTGDSFAEAENNSRYRLENIWDVVDASSGYREIFANQFSSPMPQQFTIDLGRKVGISRFQLLPRSTDERYSGSYPRTFQLWGSTNPPIDGSYNNWFLLGEWSVSKPSGYGEGGAVGTITAEDLDYFNTRQEYELIVSDQVTDPYQTISYLRFRTTSTFTTYGTEAKTGQVIIGEITLWGQLRDEE